MTFNQREAYRAELRARLLADVERQLAIVNRTLTCRNALEASKLAPETALREFGMSPAALHAKCKGEYSENPGCLCECHDVPQGTVEFGLSQVTPQ